MQNEIQYILYNLPEEEGKVQVVIKDETIWCTQKAMSRLFGVGIPAINKHLKNIFEEGELDEDVVVSKMEITTRHGAVEGKIQHKETGFYNLDAIISVGYRVNSIQATRFRQWATKVLNEYIRKGFALDDDRLKQGTAVFGKDYFRELLERIRSIRASERRIWQQITDIYAECSIDYDTVCFVKICISNCCIDAYQNSPRTDSKEKRSRAEADPHSQAFRGRCCDTSVSEHY